MLNTIICLNRLGLFANVYILTLILFNNNYTLYTICSLHNLYTIFTQSALFTIFLSVPHIIFYNMLILYLLLTLSSDY